MPHLTMEEKHQIKALLESGLSCHTVAKQLGRCPSTIRRERRRGWTDLGHYSPRCSARLYQRSRTCSGRTRRRLTGDLWRWVRRRLPIPPSAVFIASAANG